MAVNTVSSVNYDNWQLIGTNLTTSGTTSSFSSLSGYKRLMFTFNGVNTAANCAYRIRFNSDSGNNYAYLATAGGSYATTDSSILLLSFNTTGPHSGYVLIEDVLTSSPKRVEVAGNYYVGSGGKGIWLGTSPITSVDFSISTSTLNAGSVSLYGIAA